MILELLINIIVGVAAFFINLIPDFKFDSGFMNGFSDVAAIMDIFAYVIPVGTFIGCLSVFFLLNNAQFIISIGNWLIRKIPFIN